MRNLALGLFTNYKDLLIDTAKEIQSIHPEDDCLTDPYRKMAFQKLAPLRNEIKEYPTFRLERLDMLKIADVSTQIFEPIDSQFIDGVLDTTRGNESITLRIGVILASIISNERMLQEIHLHNRPIAHYLNEIYDIFAIDPGDPTISQISMTFIKENPIDAASVLSLLEKATKLFVEEIHRIPEKENYLARHMFLTGFNEYPGIGYEFEIIRTANVISND